MAAVDTTRSATREAQPLPQIVAHSVERVPTGWTSWITTTDHKRIGIMYLVLTYAFFLLGGVEALLMRDLAAPTKYMSSCPSRTRCR